MTIFRAIFIITLIGIFCLGMATVSYADTVVMNNDEQVKGVVVEEYKDRIVLSTVDGEKQIMRRDIKTIKFDLEEQNLASFGDYYQDRKRYKKAYYYYQRALAINPYYKRARDGLNYVQTYLANGGRAEKLRHIDRLNRELKGGRGAMIADMQEQERQLRASLGISLKNVGQSFVVSSVAIGSPAEKAGIREGDVLVVIWGRPTKYMHPAELMDKILDPSIMDAQLVIERSYILEIENKIANPITLLGAKLGFSEMEGLEVTKVYKGSVADKAGIKEGDLVLEVQGKTTRYMPLKIVEQIINSRKGKTLSLKIRREVIVWKKFIGSKR